MPFTPPDDFWIEIPGGTYTLGLLPNEARRLAEVSAEEAKKDPPTLGLNIAKNLRRSFDWESKDCNVAWLTEYLLAHYPVHEVSIAPFSISRRPITNQEFRRFMDETGEIEPAAWKFAKEFAPHDFAYGIDWVAADAFARWAGARLPCSDEWERALRGPQRWLFASGDLYEPNAKRINANGFINIGGEWCADRWEEPAGIVRSDWNEIEPVGFVHVMKGSAAVRTAMSIPSLAANVALGFSYGAFGNPGFRLVKADGRDIPVADYRRDQRALADVREFELKRLRPVLDKLGALWEGDTHKVDIGCSNDIGWYLRKHDQPAERVLDNVSKALQATGGGDVRAGFSRDTAEAASEYREGLYIVARSFESVQRIIREHGVFVWSIGYCLAEDGVVRARHVAGCHMMFDKNIHTLSYQFRHGEEDTPISDITPEMLERGILAAFNFYEDNADRDRSPF